VRGETTRVRPTYIHDYLARQGAQGRVHVKTGAWNTEDHYGDDFTQWSGTSQQKEAHARVQAVSEHFHAIENRLKQYAPASELHEVRYHINEAQWRLLRAQTSCNFYWAQAWTPKVHGDLDLCEAHLSQAVAEFA